MFTTEESTEGKGLVSSVTLSFVAVLMNLLTTFLNFLTPMERRDIELRRRSLVNVGDGNKYVLVTGCDRGFGFATAKKLDELGFFVLAGCLDVNSDQSRQLRCGASGKLRTFQLDVTNGKDLKNLQEWIKNNIPDRALWGIVNNAGVCFIGTPEIMSWDDITKIIDVNFRGTINVTRTFLPFVRRCQGRVVNIGSVNGDVPMPFFSIYNATKAAIKMFTETLSYEMKDWGVRASLIAPAGFKTGIIQYDRDVVGSRWWAAAGQDVQKDYGKEYFTMPFRESGRVKVSEDYSVVVDSVVHALTSDSPKPVYRPGHGGVLLPTIVRFSPSSFRTYLCGSLLNFISSKPQALNDSSEPR